MSVNTEKPESGGNSVLALENLAGVGHVRIEIWSTRQRLLQRHIGIDAIECHSFFKEIPIFKNVGTKVRNQ